MGPKDWGRVRGESRKCKKMGWNGNGIVRRHSIGMAFRCPTARSDLGHPHENSHENSEKNIINKTSSPKWNFNYAGASGWHAFDACGNVNATLFCRQNVVWCTWKHVRFDARRASPFRVRQFKWYANGSPNWSAEKIRRHKRNTQKCSFLFVNLFLILFFVYSESDLWMFSMSGEVQTHAGVDTDPHSLRRQSTVS